MAYRIPIMNFSKGELSPELHARTDVAAYQAGAKRVRNFLILKYGGLTKRPGTRFVGEAYDQTQPCRLAPFQFSITQSYALEMGQGYMRPIALGGFILNEALAVTGVTNAVNAQVSAAYHGYAVGDQVYFPPGTIQGMTEINGRIAKVVAVVNAGAFKIDLDTTGFGTFTGSTEGVTRPGPPDPEPPPPVVPPVVPPETPPDVGGGGGGNGGGRAPGGGDLP
jgi:hypothetical protein